MHARVGDQLEASRTIGGGAPLRGTSRNLEGVDGPARPATHVSGGRGEEPGVCVCDGGVSVSVSVSVCDTNTPWGGSHLAVMVCVNACALTAVGCCGGICCECAMQSSPFVTYLLRSIHM